MNQKKLEAETLALIAGSGVLDHPETLEMKQNILNGLRAGGWNCHEEAAHEITVWRFGPGTPMAGVLFNGDDARLQDCLGKMEQGVLEYLRESSTPEEAAEAITVLFTTFMAQAAIVQRPRHRFRGRRR